MSAVIPVSTPISQPFWEGLKEEVIRVPRCDECSHWIFYPRRHCTHCGSLSMTWREISGRATLCSYTLARVPTLEEFAADPPQNLAIVTLEEGFNVNSSLVDIEPGDMRIGMALRPVFAPVGDSGARRLLFTAA
ncbi:MAG: hypothetical protein CME40_08010 [Haliea sp.]|nr:hypothetical protein [Haliea sp.]|tara:strand:- start:307168 stop:307569 length:402 start_codon:yes stop_codon:yes gene_type:complete